FLQLVSEQPIWELCGWVTIDNCPSKILWKRCRGVGNASRALLQSVSGMDYGSRGCGNGGY
ncbi:hypothetical protein PIB30_068674, partial [Stylosanthes scabra]|nr:hypothetical protein [Stylosanthes scabra]